MKKTLLQKIAVLEKDKSQQILERNKMTKEIFRSDIIRLKSISLSF